MIQLNKIFSKRVLSILGVILSILGIVFIVVRMSMYVGQINLGRFYLIDWLQIIILIFIYAFSGLFLALAWHKILLFLKVNTEKKWAIKIYGLSQIAKYIPGNIFQFVGRQSRGMTDGVQGKVLLKSTVLELVLLAFSGSLFVILILPLVGFNVSLFISFVLFCFVLCFVIITLRSLFSLPLGVAFIWQIIFLLISAMIFVAVLFIINPSIVFVSNISIFLGVYIIAWLGGLITPGAPGGIGIREIVLLFFLKSLVPEVDLLLAILLSRVVTVVGDFTYFLIAMFIKYDKKYKVD